MKTRNEFALVPALLLGLSITAFAADEPANAPTKPAISKSDQWFRVQPTAGYVHIAIRPSGDEDAPVRVIYEYKRLYEETPVMWEVDSLCMNDEWLNPVKMTMILHQPEEDVCEFTITRPDPKFAAGKMIIDWQRTQNEQRELNARALLDIMSLAFVVHLPFEKDKSSGFATFETNPTGINDWTLSYMGKEHVPGKGEMGMLNLFMKVGKVRRFAMYWLTDKHELVLAQFDGMTITPATETEARQPIADWEAKKAGAENAARMSEGIAGCGTIRAAMRIRFKQYDAYPTLDGVTGDQLESALRVAPGDLNGKYFKAVDYVVNSTAKGFTIKATLGAQTYVIDEKGVESGTFRTK